MNVPKWATFTFFESIFRCVCVHVNLQSSAKYSIRQYFVKSYWATGFERSPTFLAQKRKRLKTMLLQKELSEVSNGLILSMLRCYISNFLAGEKSKALHNPNIDVHCKYIFFAIKVVMRCMCDFGSYAYTNKKEYLHSHKWVPKEISRIEFLQFVFFFLIRWQNLAYLLYFRAVKKWNYISTTISAVMRCVEFFFHFNIVQWTMFIIHRKFEFGICSYYLAVKYVQKCCGRFYTNNENLSPKCFNQIKFFDRIQVVISLDQITGP